MRGVQQFSPNEYISIHRRLFHGIYKHAGGIRDYNITKKEWVLVEGYAGMMDLVQSLRWIRDNIAGFGGDPDNDIY